MRHENFLTDTTISDTGFRSGIRRRMNELKNPNGKLHPELHAEYLMNDGKEYSFGLDVRLVGWQKILPDTTYPLKEHPKGYSFDVRKGRILSDEYLLVYITDGTGKFYVKKNEWGGVSVKGGTLFWLTPGQWHSYMPDIQTGWTEYYIGYKGEEVEKFIRHSFMEGKSGAFDIGLNEELVSLYMRALDIARLKDSFYQSYLSGIVLHMLGLVMSRLKEKVDYSCKNEQKIELAKIIMREKLAANLDFKQLAGSLDLSYSYFRRLFKDYTGIGPARYFFELKIDKVKQLLLTTDMSVKEILYTLGYNTTENFHVVFKKHTGYTPIEYRRMMLEKKKVIG